MNPESTTWFAARFTVALVTTITVVGAILHVIEAWLRYWLTPYIATVLP